LEKDNPHSNHHKSMTIDETTFLAAARSGDQEAFAQLVEPYRKQLLVHCYRILGSFEDAEDMLQETLVRVWKRLDSFEGRSSLRAWLYKIATNASLDALDSRRVRGLPKELYERGDPTQPILLPHKQTGSNLSPTNGSMINPIFIPKRVMKFARASRWLLLRRCKNSQADNAPSFYCVM
jgi:RNA polymerase sigma factor (sigma-70 family)